jgi:hypothetical protein
MKTAGAGAFRYRRMQLLEGMPQDAYRAGRKPAGPAACPDCGAVHDKGRWKWADAPAGARALRCPACRRTAERAPAGLVSLSGGFFAAHRDEVLARARNCERMEMAEHPLERIIAIRRGAAETRIETTSVHLAHLIGRALRRAFKGRLAQSYHPDDNLLRVRWSRAPD